MKNSLKCSKKHTNFKHGQIIAPAVQTESVMAFTPTACHYFQKREKYCI